MSCPTPGLLFVASSLDDEGQAQSELDCWAEANGYHPPQDGAAFVFYQGGTQVREWRLIQRPMLDTAH